MVQNIDLDDFAPPKNMHSLFFPKVVTFNLEL